MFIVTKKPVTIQKDIVGFEEKKIGFQFGNPVITESGGIIGFRVIDGTQVENRQTGRKDFQSRSQSNFELTNEELANIVSNRDSKFEILVSKVVEYLKPVNSNLTISDLQEEHNKK